MNNKAHWDRVYQDNAPDRVSWYQSDPEVSLRLIQDALPDVSAAIIDVGGGASTLVDGLVAASYQRISVLDLSAAALTAARRRMGPPAASVQWVEGDVLAAQLPAGAFDLWHDRAAFHFLTDPADRLRYVEQVRYAVKQGGLVLVATFAEDGPTRCSGLDVARYSSRSLHAEFGSSFRLLRSIREDHHTPDGRVQPFTYCLCQILGTLPD